MGFEVIENSLNEVCGVGDVVGEWHDKVCKRVCSVLFACQMLYPQVMSAKDLAVFSPYIDSTAYPITKIADIERETGQKDYTLGFVTSDKGSCDASWGGYYDIDDGPSSWNHGKEEYFYDEIKKVQNKGGKITISLGGASGTPLFIACKDEKELFNEYDEIIKKLDVKILDFDIEGESIQHISDIRRLISTINKLKEKYNDLIIWFTLPAIPSGLNEDGINILKLIYDNRLTDANINIMTMNYGELYTGNMFEDVKNTIEQVNNQMKDVFGAKIDYYDKIGITPMIGKNDTGETFSIEDMKKLFDYINKNFIKKISFWSLNRDKNGVQNSSGKTDKYEYLSIARENIK